MHSILHVSPLITSLPEEGVQQNKFLNDSIMMSERPEMFFLFDIRHKGKKSVADQPKKGRRV